MAISSRLSSFRMTSPNTLPAGLRSTAEAYTVAQVIKRWIENKKFPLLLLHALDEKGGS